MSLLDQARAMARSVLNDLAGFGTPLTLTSPDGISASINGLGNDIGLSIDPETGLSVSGRKVTVTICIQDLTAAGLTIPENVPDEDEKPWLVQLSNSQGPLLLKVVDSVPDQTLGIVVLHLGKYRTDLP